MNANLHVSGDFRQPTLKVLKELSVHISFPIQSPLPAVFSWIPYWRIASLADTVRRTISTTAIPTHFNQVLPEDVACPQRRYQIVEFSFVAVDVTTISPSVLTISNRQAFRNSGEHSFFAGLSIDCPFTKLNWF